MEATRSWIRIFVFVAGPLVLVSYLYGLSRIEDKMALWGGIPSSWVPYIVPFMFVAAIGFLIYWWISLFQLDVEQLQSFRWPWSDSDGNGLNRLLLAYSLFLIPSALWLESTLFHMSNEHGWTPILVIGTLFVAAIGNVMMGLLAYSAYQDGIEGAGLMFVGTILLAIQVIFNDLIVWSYKFPW
ncbi:MAG: hypothetical protein QGI21_03795 [Candidatus Poseidoniaceae archaeon]|jgi:hypothetical protein|nr:hypothetical protein [Candidatus Poseidoniaceae archaeon]